jgi:hypothetical protein
MDVRNRTHDRPPLRYPADVEFQHDLIERARYAVAAHRHCDAVPNRTSVQQTLDLCDASENLQKSLRSIRSPNIRGDVPVK